jgi:enamine deaminase RidA (YjgF/YER057c/UK114 family)
VRVDYAGRAHCIISGTASIDNKGQIVHPGDVQAQTRRMWENVEALLAEGGARWGDIAQATVYLRNPSDYGLVADMLAEKLKGIPYVILHAPVCRPGWLVEMECMALT